MEIVRACEKCGKENTINSTNLKKADLHDEERNCVRVTYYACDDCGHKNIVQYDDAETRGIYSKVEHIVVKCMRKRIKNETVSPKDKKKQERLSKQLRKKREVLEKQFSDKELYMDDGKIFS